jgi:hypothetical protein
VLHKFHLSKINNVKMVPVLFKGSQWFSIRQSTINVIFDYIEENSEYMDFFRHSFCSDEIFFHTIIMNNKEKLKVNITLEKNIPLKAKRYIDWQSGPEYPKNLMASDFDNIKSSGCLFARKASSDLTLEQLEDGFR